MAAPRKRLDGNSSSPILSEPQASEASTKGRQAFLVGGFDRILHHASLKLFELFGFSVRLDAKPERRVITIENR
jgi:hypothetical protein